MAEHLLSTNESTVIRHYFVDEAGDGALFDKRGKVIIGTEGCSRFFMLGVLDVADPEGLKRCLDELRAQLMSDPYFKSVPSMQPQAQKTARFFHAKDDLPEVRREVFALLRRTEGLRYFAIVTDKWQVLEYVLQRNLRDPAYRYHPNELYDYLVRRLFRDLLHKAGGYKIVFAKRGASDRTSALRKALEAARDRFTQRWGIKADAPIEVLASTPVMHAGLQAADYFTWALQRLYEKGEERYLTYLWGSVRLVIDIDDKRTSNYGVYYTQKKPLTAADLEWRKQKAGDIGLQ